MAFIGGASHYLPSNTVHNHDLLQFPEKYRDLIAQKAGIHSRRHVTDECTSDLGAGAVKALLARTGVAASAVGALICATSSPDRIQPATATRIQEMCGLKSAFAFDVNSVCTGGIYALRLAAALVADGAGNVVVVASEVYSKILNPTDISTFPYFGDGAGAVLVSDSGEYELKDFLLASDGSGADVIQVPGGGTMLPSPCVTNEKDRYFTMVGSKVYSFACEKGSETLKCLVDRRGGVPEAVVTHQANINIVREIAGRTSIAESRFFVNLDRYGNTAGASVLIGLSELLESKSPDSIGLVAFGGGLSWGGCWLERV